MSLPHPTTFYNAWHPYRRNLIDPRGDECEFLSVSEGLLLDASQSHGGSIIDEPGRPFAVSHAPCPPRVYLKQRALFESSLAAEIDPLSVEEQYLLLVHEIIHSGQNFSVPAADHACPFQREQVATAKQYMAANYCQGLKLPEIAASADCSVYHLCRIFKKFAGVTVHQFLTQLRLRNALERLLDSDRSILNVALDLGFSSQSHFTSAFRMAFGLSPGELRKTRGQSILNT